jgi:hypothetical protein
MSNWIASALAPARWRIAARCKRLRRRLARFARAWRYAADTLSAEQARAIIEECEYAAGQHALLTLSTEDTLKQARRIYADHPTLGSLVATGCAEVARHWEDCYSQIEEAQDWAIAIASDFAAMSGVALIRRDAGANPPTD